MLAGLERYAAVRFTPTDQRNVTVSNPLGVVPKYVHITAPHDSTAYNRGFYREGWLITTIGGMYNTNGSTSGEILSSFLPVNETPTVIETYYATSQEIVIKAGNAAVSNKFDTNTEYTFHFYA